MLCLGNPKNPYPAQSRYMCDSQDRKIQRESTALLSLKGEDDRVAGIAFIRKKLTDVMWS